jgi:Protein of unknown function (DUF3574)
LANHRDTLNFASAIAIICSLTGSAVAQSPATSQADAVKSEIYFGSDMGAGKSVGKQAWEEFLSDVVTARFPAGITVIEALGQGTRAAGPLTPTRILVVVNASGAEAQNHLREIKAEYTRRFGSAGVFHTDQPVQIRD